MITFFWTGVAANEINGRVVKCIQEVSFLNKHIVSKLIHTLIVYCWRAQAGCVVQTAWHWPPSINPYWQERSDLVGRRKQRRKREEGGEPIGKFSQKIEDRQSLESMKHLNDSVFRKTLSQGISEDLIYTVVANFGQFTSLYFIKCYY